MCCLALVLTAVLAASPDEELASVAAVHGEAGPWAVAGYRMAKQAMKVLEAGPFELEVDHQSPKSVQYSCIADGAQAATKASVGKLSLRWTEVKDAGQTQTTFKNVKTGKTLTLKPSVAFVKRFLNAPRERAQESGRVVLGLPDADIFDVVHN
jgi:formylmethanofuran dehydrogenase subunit E